MIDFTLPSWQLIQLLAAVVFPLLVGLVTTRTTDPGRKAVLLAGLAVLTSLATELGAALQSGAAYDLGQALILGVGSFLVAVGLHYGLWKPTGAAAAAQRTGAGKHALDPAEDAPAEQ